jgi:adenylate cyclase
MSAKGLPPDPTARTAPEAAVRSSSSRRGKTGFAQLTRELTEERRQRKATSEVLRLLSGSHCDLRELFGTILASATELCQAKFGTLSLCEGDAFRIVAMHNVPAAFAELRRREPLIRARPMLEMAATKQILHIADVAEYAGLHPDDADAAVFANLAAVRTVLGVPMFKDGAVVGAIVVYREEVQEFAKRQIELVEDFAAQALIAIENARLFRELREKTDQLQLQSEELAKLNHELEQRVAAQVGEIERMGRLRRFLPPQVADLIVASGMEKQLESHRREVTALFCDLRGFTGFSETSDPEDVMALLRDYHAAIGEIIIKYGGTLERYAGDGVMVVFNDPVAVENPSLQAVLMALEMRDAIEALTEKWRRLGYEIGFGIGIAHGFATLGTIGFEGRFDYAAIGMVSNVASRLCDEAKPGQILISPRVLIAVEHAVAAEAVGEFVLKGIRRPMTAYNVLSTRAIN